MRINSHIFLLLLILCLINSCFGTDQDNTDNSAKALTKNPPPFSICSKSDCSITNSSYQQTAPAALALEDGGFILVWKAKNSSQSFANIYGKIYNSDGTSRTSIFPVNNHSKPDTANPTLALFPNNNVFVTWVVGTSLYGCIIKPDGTKFGPDFQLASDIGVLEQRISITVLKDGKFAIFYADSIFVSDTAGNRFRKANLVKIERDSFYTANYQSIVSLDSGGFAIFYTQRSVLYGEIYNSNSTKVGSIFIIGTNIGHSIRPAAASLSSGNILVMWSNDSDPINYVIHGQVFTQSGTAKGSQFKIASGKDIQPAWILPLKNKEFVATWYSSSSGMLYGQQFKSDNTAKSTVFIISSTAVREIPDLIILKDDSYLAVSTTQSSVDSTIKLIAWMFNLPVVFSSTDDDSDGSGSSSSPTSSGSSENSSNSTSNLKNPQTSSDSNNPPTTIITASTTSDSYGGPNVGVIVGVSLGCVFCVIMVYCIAIRAIRRRRAMKLSPEVPLNAIPKLQHENSFTANIMLPNENTTIAIQENGADIGDSIDIKIPFEQQICVLPDNSAIYINALDISSTNMIIKPNQHDFQPDFASDTQADFAPALDPQDARDFVLDGRLAKPHLKNAYQLSQSKEYNAGLRININNEEIIPIRNMQQSVHLEPDAFRGLINEGKFAPPIEEAQENVQIATMQRSVHFEPDAFKTFVIGGKFAPPVEVVKEVGTENVHDNDIEIFDVDETKSQKEEKKDVDAIDNNETEDQKEEKKDDDSNNNKMCIICEDEASVMVFLDCMHICTCQQCSVKVASSTNQCPVCRERIRDIRKVFVI